MKAGLAKVKPFAGLFLEALMLTIIIACAQSEVTIEKSVDGPYPLTTMTVLQRMVLCCNQCMESLHPTGPRHDSVDGTSPLLKLDLLPVGMVLSNALNIGHIKRNYFYAYLTAHAP
jgi:hypothetical protein